LQKITELKSLSNYAVILIQLLRIIYAQSPGAASGAIKDRASKFGPDFYFKPYRLALKKYEERSRFFGLLLKS
jgi:hypothetical protein